MKKLISHFQLWNKLKQISHFKKERPFFREQEIWFCMLGANIGFEQDGRGKEFLRPVLVIKKFNHETFWAIPMTKNIKQGSYYHTISFRKGNSSALILSQIRLIDAKRLMYRIGVLKKRDCLKVKTKLKNMLI